MAACSGLRSRVTEVVTCPICLEDFKDPRSLPCVHSFCLHCLQGYCKDKCPGDDVPCPLCRKEFQIPRDGLEALPHNFFLQNLVDAKTTMKLPGTSFCEPCSEMGQTKSATVYCIDCSQKLCDRCSVPHKKWKGKPHDVRAMGDELSAELIWLRGSYCDKHPGRRLELYCFDCRENICMKCFEVSHNHHKYEEIEKVAKDFVASIQSAIKPLPSRISQFREAVKRVELANRKFLENLKDIELKVQKKSDEMKRLVDDHTVKLMQELDEAKTRSVKETQTRVDGFELAVTALESFEAYSCQLTSKGSACDITRAANCLHVRVDELLKTYVTSSSDYVLPDIEFLAASVEEITGGQNIVGSLITSTDAAKVPEKTSGPIVVPQRGAKNEQTARKKFSQSDTPRVPEKTVGLLAAAIRRQKASKGVKTARKQYLQSNPQVVHTFTKSEHVCGVTLLNNELYVLRQRRSDQVDVYFATDFTLLRRLNVNGLSDHMMDITSCIQKQCVYISDADNNCIHRVGLDKSVSKWPVSGTPESLSVTRGCNLLVTCVDMNGPLVELSSEDGKPVREITRQSGIACPWHSIQLANHQFVVCHGDDSSAVSLVGFDGRVIRSWDGLDWPCRMAVDNDEFIFVADLSRIQIVLLDPSLEYVCHVLRYTESGPWCLCFDDVTRRLYVGQWGDGIVSVVQL